MTPKQYLKRWKLSPNAETLAEIMNDLLQELNSAKGKIIMEYMPHHGKKVRCPLWPARILRSLNKKWCDFSKFARDSSIVEESMMPAENWFEEVIKLKLPVLYGASLWMQIWKET
jgi:hypothetical protein